MKKHAKMAAAFVAALREQLTDSEFQTMRYLNTVETIPGICHSHDFCDANMPAFAATGRKRFSDGAIKDINAMWELAMPSLRCAEELPGTMHGKAWDDAPASLRYFVNGIVKKYADGTRGMYDGLGIHAYMAEHALSHEFDENTGGWVWLSYTIDIDPVSDIPIFICCGIDTCYVYMLPDTGVDDLLSVSPARCAEIIFDLCGEDDVLLSAYVVEEDQS